MQSLPTTHTNTTNAHSTPCLKPLHYTLHTAHKTLDIVTIATTPHYTPLIPLKLHTAYTIKRVCVHTLNVRVICEKRYFV